VLPVSVGCAAAQAANVLLRTVATSPYDPRGCVCKVAARRWLLLARRSRAARALDWQL